MNQISKVEITDLGIIRELIHVEVTRGLESTGRSPNYSAHGKNQTWIAQPIGIHHFLCAEETVKTLQLRHMHFKPPQRILVITARNQNGQNRNGHKPKRPQTETATDRKGHRPERPQTETATNRNGHRPERPQTGTAINRKGHKPKRPQTETATNRTRHNYVWFSGLQICVLNRSF